MKFNFRKISAIAASALMTGMTLGAAAAANYPAPFVSGGVANVAVVYGTGAGVSTLDLVQAGNIQDSLGTYVDAGEVVVEGGESFVLDKTSNHFNLGQALNVPYTKLDDSNMDFLAEGTYDDGDVNEDYTQKITPSAQTLDFFADSNYKDKDPTIGFWWENGDNVLDYDIEFNDGIPWADLNDTDMPILGKSYYVLSATPSTIEMLDSAEKVVLSEGDTVTVGDKTVSIEYIESNAVKFNVDGEITSTLNDHDYEELDDGSYIIANDIMYASKETGVSKVEFSIGAGKMTLNDGDEIKVNDEAVDGLYATFSGTGPDGMTGLNIAWNSDDDSFLTEENALTMPLFKTVQLVFGGLNFPTEPEEITLGSGEQFTLSMGNYELPLFFFAGTSGTISTLGEEDNPLVTAVGTLTANYTGTIGDTANANATALTGGMDLTEDMRFLVTSLDTDLSDIDTLYYEVTKINYEDGEVLVELKDLIGTNDITFDDTTDTPEQGDITLSMVNANDTRVYLKFAADTGTISYNTAVSEKGLEVLLPAKSSANVTNNLATGVTLLFTEADKEDDLGKGSAFTAVVKANSNDMIHAYSTNVTTKEYANDQEFGYLVSDLATKVTTDTTADEYGFDIAYYGEEVDGQVMVVGGAATVSGGSNTLGNILVKDTEVSSVATKNLIVVGGSCINSAAAALVGGTKCGASWTAATGIGSGQFLIKGYADSTITSGLALLVAGYDAEDTVKATTYLTNKVVDTSKAYKGTTSTELAVVIE